MKKWMQLREFDLDAPEALQSERIRFRSQSRTVTALYERCFNRLAVRRGWKVLLECVPRVTRSDVRDLLGVLTLQIQFDIYQLRNIDDVAKKRTMLDVLQRGVLLVAEAEGWPLAPFENAQKCVIDKNLTNEWWWKDAKLNRTGTLSGQLWCCHDIDAFRAWLVVKDIDGCEITRRLVLNTDPSEFVFVSKLGYTRWTHDRRFVLLAKDKSEIGAIDLE